MTFVSSELLKSTLITSSLRQYQISGLKCVNATSRSTGISLKLLQNVQLKKVYFDCLPISKMNYDDLQSNYKKLYTVLSYLGVFTFCTCCILICTSVFGC